MRARDALQLADALELDPMPLGWYVQAAAELRRRHVENERLRSAARDALRFLESLPDDLGRGSWNEFRVQSITALREALGDKP